MSTNFWLKIGTVFSWMFNTKIPSAVDSKVERSNESDFSNSSSARLRSVMSLNTMTKPENCPCSFIIGLPLYSTGIRVPSFATKIGNSPNKMVISGCCSPFSVRGPVSLSSAVTRNVMSFPSSSSCFQPVSASAIGLKNVTVPCSFVVTTASLRLRSVAASHCSFFCIARSAA